jgi:hypothetical protein
MNRVLNRRKIQHLLEIHIETYWFQRSLQNCLVEVDRITRKNFDLNKEMKEAILQPRNPLVTFETNKFLCEFQANVEFGQNKESWDKYTSYSSRSSFICINFDGFEDFYTSGYKINFPQNSVCFQI